MHLIFLTNSKVIIYKNTMYKKTEGAGVGSITFSTELFFL